MATSQTLLNRLFSELQNCIGFYIIFFLIFTCSTLKVNNLIFRMEMRLAVNFSAYQERFSKLSAVRQSGRREMYRLCYDSHPRVSA